IGIALIAGILTHAIGHHFVGFGGGSHHSATGTHTKAVNRTTVARVVYQFITRRPQLRVASKFSQSGFIDHALWVLDAKADSEWFGFDINTALVQPAKCVACAVSERKDDMAAKNFFAVLQNYPLHAI